MHRQMTDGSQDTDLPSQRSDHLPRKLGNRSGFTLVELLVVVSIIALLISILVPSLRGARRQALRITCQANVKQQLLAVQLYLTENDDRFPVAKNYDWEKFTYPKLVFADYFQDAMLTYLPGARGDADPDVDFSLAFRCPDVERGPSSPRVAYLSEPDQSHYRYNTHMAIMHAEQIGRASSTVWSPADAMLHYDVAFPDWQKGDFPHQAAEPKINVGYVDGHVDWINYATYIKLSPKSEFKEEATNKFITYGWTKRLAADIAQEEVDDTSPP